MAQKKKISYWEKRNLDAEMKINNRAIEVERIIISAYKQAQNYLTNQVKKLFDRSRTQTKLSKIEARQLLNETVPIEQLTELKRLSLNVTNPELQVEAKRRLTALAFKDRITRAEDLKAKSYLVSKQVADAQLEKATDFYIDAIHESYNEASAEAAIHTLEARGVTFEIWNKQISKTGGREFTELSTEKVKNILDSHWLGSNYSKRLWGDTEALSKRLEELFTVEAMTGMSESEMARVIAEEFNRSINVARRLIRTEANYMANQAKLRAWMDRGVENYKLAVVLDLRTSDICQKKSKEDRVYKVSEAVVNGADGTYPPFHPWCRTIAIAYYKRTTKGEKLANDPVSSKTITIKQSAVYEDWMNLLKEQYSETEIQKQKKKLYK